MKKNYILGIMIMIISFIFSGCIFNNDKTNKTTHNNDKKDFTYQVVIRVGGLDDVEKVAHMSDEFTSLVYNIRIKPIDANKVYEKLVATAYFDNSLIDKLMLQNEYFTSGGAVDENEGHVVTIGGNVSKALDFGTATWLRKSEIKDLDVYELLRKDIKVKVKWEDGEEHYTIPKEDIVFNKFLEDIE